MRGTIVSYLKLKLTLRLKFSNRSVSDERGSERGVKGTIVSYLKLKLTLRLKFSLSLNHL